MIITNDILNKKVPKDIIPTRLDSALNLYTVISYKEKQGIILYNINPTTWNCLYPFYESKHKFTIDNYISPTHDITYGQLISDYQKIYKQVYENESGNLKEVRKKILLDEFKKTFNLNNANISDELSCIYELKYSKSQNVWTLYYFENYIANNINNLDILLDQKLYEQKILPLNGTTKCLDNIEIVSNLTYLLSIEDNIKKLKRNILKCNY